MSSCANGANGIVTFIIKTLVSITALSFLGYCIYFDYVRHQDPAFKEKLKKRRARERQKMIEKFRCEPPPKKLVDYQKYFIQEISLGEQMLAAGHTVDSVCHLANAVMICPNKSQMMEILQQTLPPDLFKQLIVRIDYLKSVPKSDQ